MALHKQSDFAKLCGVTNAYLSVNKKRGKIILSGDYIDDSIPENSDFLQKFLLKKKEDTEEVPNVKPPIKPLPKTPNVAVPNLAEVGQGMFALDRAVKLQDYEKKKVETRLLELKEQKQIGEVIPTDLVKVVFVQHSQSIITEFKNGIEDILTLFAKKKGMNTNEISEMRGSLVTVINVAVDKAVNLSKKNISNIINEYSLKREVGERE